MIGEESVRLLAFGAPDIASLLMLIDAASLIDAAVAAVLVATSVRVGAVRARIGGALRRLFGGRLGRRTIGRPDAANAPGANRARCG